MSGLRLVAAVMVVGFVGSVASAQSIERMLAAFKKVPPDISPDAAEQLEKLREGTTAITEKAKAAIRDKAMNVAYKVTLAEYHEAPKAKDDSLQPRKPDRTVDAILTEASRGYVTDGNQKTLPWSKLNENQRDYHREYGAALFNAILAVMIEKDPPPFLRLNAARLLGPAAESASPAVARGLTKLLTGQVFVDEKKAPFATPPDVLYQTLRAAEIFLDHYEVTRPGAKDLQPEELGDLVAAIAVMVEKGPPILDKVAPVASPKSPADQTNAKNAVVRFYRHQAVRALGKARLADGYLTKTGTVRPMHLLARVALKDAGIVPEPSLKEVGEASIGLMSLGIGQDVNADTLAFVVGLGTTEFYRARAGRTDDGKVVEWKATSQRMSALAAAWNAAAQKNSAIPEAGKKSIADVVGKLEQYLFTPLVKPEPGKEAPEVNEVAQFLAGFKATVPDILITDDRDKNKYRVPLDRKE